MRGFGFTGNQANGKCKKKYEITTIIYTVIYVSTYIWDNTLYKWVLENKEIKNSTEKSRKIKVIKK